MRLTLAIQGTRPGGWHWLCSVLIPSQRSRGACQLLTLGLLSPLGLYSPTQEGLCATQPHTTFGHLGW